MPNITKITDMAGAEEFANINGQTMGRIFPNLQKGAATQ